MKKSSTNRLPLFICFLLLCTYFTNTFATKYYVSTTGNNSNNGTSTATAWATIQAFGSLAKAGDTLTVLAGTFAGAIFGWDGPNQGQYSLIAGTAAKPITIQADPKAAPGTVIINSKNNQTAIALDLEPGCDYVNLVGFTITNAGGTITKAGIKVVESTGNKILNNTVNGVGGIGGIFVNIVTNVLIENNTCIFTKGTNTTGHGMYLAGKSSGLVVRNNSLHDNDYVGLHINGDPDLVTNTLIENNYIYNNGQNGINADGLQSSTIRNNLIYGNDRHGITLYQIDASGGGVNNLIVNNTILAQGSGSSVGIDVVTGSGNIAFNNILIGTSGASSGSGIMLSNNITTSSASLFVNASGNDYHLPPNSPAVNTGVITFSGKTAPTSDITGAARPQGAGYDIGAYEYVPATGIIDMGNKLPYSIFPNPFNTIVTIKISQEIIIKDALMKLYDVSGKEVKIIYINSNETTVNSSELQSGVYFYAISNNNRNVGWGKLLVQ